VTPVTLCLVRHAQPIAPPGICYGSLDLQAEPQAAQALARHLVAELPAGTLILHSPATRCVQTVSHLQAMNAPFRYQAEARMAEMHFGQWEGKPWDRIAKTAFDAWMADFADYRCGHDGESTRQVLQRVADVARESLHIAQRERAHTLAWLTHAGIMRSLEWWLRHDASAWLAQPMINWSQVPSPRAADWPDRALDFGALHRVPLPRVLR
jgi:alpha-ribazole phosphatase